MQKFQVSLFSDYKTKIAPILQKELGYKNIFQVPRVEKVVINVGVGRFSKDKQYLEKVEEVIKRISGLKPVQTKARKAISNFKIRSGSIVGEMVTLRGKRMYDFLEKLIRITLPRVRDFHGLSPKSFDQNGNYSIGFQEFLPFPEIRSDEVDMVFGLQVIINTTAKNKEEGMKLLSALGFPFEK
jgi:large subunit ribosomal protein L5